MNKPLEITDIRSIVREARERNSLVFKAGCDGYMSVLTRHGIQKNEALKKLEDFLLEGKMVHRLATVTVGANGAKLAVIQDCIIIDAVEVEEERLKIDVALRLESGYYFVVRGLVTTNVSIDDKMVMMADDYGIEDQNLILEAWDTKLAEQTNDHPGTLH